MVLARGPAGVFSSILDFQLVESIGSQKLPKELPRRSRVFLRTLSSQPVPKRGTQSAPITEASQMCPLTSAYPYMHPHMHAGTPLASYGPPRPSRTVSLFTPPVGGYPPNPNTSLTCTHTHTCVHSHNNHVHTNIDPRTRKHMYILPQTNTQRETTKVTLARVSHWVLVCGSVFV
jgi:hypothetical protein